MGGIEGLEDNVEALKGGNIRKKQPKQAIFRSAADVVSLSLSRDGMRNRNRIILNEAQTAWSLAKTKNVEREGPEEEVTSILYHIEDMQHKRREEEVNGL